MLNKRAKYAYAVILYSSLAWADGQPSTALYVGGSIGYGQTALSSPPMVTAFQRTGITWSILTGLQLCQNLAVEAAYNRMRNVFAAVPSQNATATVKPSFTYFAFKGSLPLRNQTSLYGRLGAAYSYGKEIETINGSKIVNSSGKIVPYVSVGLEYELMPQLYMDASISNAFKTSGIPRLTTAAVGLRYSLLDLKK